MLEHGVRLFFAAVLLAGSPVIAGGPATIWLTAEDGVMVRGDLYGLEDDEKKAAPIVLLFHQAGASRAEYEPIAPRLNRLGFSALAIDQRSGGDRWGENETVAKLGESTSYLAALPDLEAALGWVESSGYSGGVIAWGSSYSAALVLLLAAEHPAVDGVLSFSPGEYLGSRTDEVRKAAKRVGQPVFVSTPTEEEERAKLVYDVLPGDRNTLVLPERAVHGSSMLVPDRNPGAEEIWPMVETFLEQFRP